MSTDSTKTRKDKAMPRTLKTILAFVAYLITIPLANYSISHWGTAVAPGLHTIPVGFGYSAPSGVLFIGLGLAGRDAVQYLVGVRWTLLAIVAGIVLSYAINPQVATASAAAFALGELIDLAVYTPIRERSYPAAVLFSNASGAVVDTFVFLPLAFHSINFWQGQVVGKIEVGVLCALFVWGWRAVPRHLALR